MILYGYYMVDIIILVCALQRTESHAVTHVPVNSLKPFWNELLDELKVKFIFWGNLWKEAGQPKFCHLFSIKSLCSLRYMNAIKQAMFEYEHKFDEALYDHFIRKESSLEMLESYI